MEDYVYTSSELDELKKYRTMKILFLLLGCLVLLLQSITWLIVWLRDIPVSTSSKVFVTITLVATFLFIASQSVFLIRNKNIVKIVKEQGRFHSKRIKLKFSDKTTWAGAFVILFRIIAIIIVVLLGVLIVTFIRNYLNWGKIVLKMPLMVLVAVQALNLSAELRYQTMLEKSKK